MTVDAAAEIRARDAKIALREAAARIAELERENAALRNRLYSLTFEMRAVGQSLTGLADTYATIPTNTGDNS